jgi:hypothetical protein
LTRDEQPAVSCLGASAEARFPLVLLFGREYNNEPDNVVRGPGQYCFRCSPRSLFWNRAYGLVSRLCGRDDFKATCIARDQAPIAFSNVLPRPIRNERSTPEKNRIRRGMEPAALADHIGGIFSMETLIARVSLVILSGADGQEFRQGTELIRAACGRRTIPMAGIAYLGSRRRSEAIEATVTADDRQRLCAIVAAFYADTARHDGAPRPSRCARCSGLAT